MSSIGNPIEWDSEGNAVAWECLDSRCRYVFGSDGCFYGQTPRGTYRRIQMGAESEKEDPANSFVLDNPEHLPVGLSENFPSTPLRVAGVNPKDRIGVKKPNLHLVPSTAIVHCAKAMEDGAAKYGPYNWRENKVIASVYVSAAERHLRQWFDGEDEAEDSGQHHLAHAMACLAILLDAQEGENLKDDRPFPGKTSELIKRLTKTD